MTNNTHGNMQKGQGIATLHLETKQIPDKTRNTVVLFFKREGQDYYIPQLTKESINPTLKHLEIYQIINIIFKIDFCVQFNYSILSNVVLGKTDFEIIFSAFLSF